MFLQKVLKVLAILTITYTSVSCAAIGKEKNEKLILENEQYYSIEPATVLSAITQGNKDGLFINHPPLKDQSEMWTLPIEKAVYWEQKDYIQVIQSLNEFIGNGPLDAWNLKMIYLEHDCASSSVGFNRGTFELFKVDNNTPQGRRSVLSIDILPDRKIIRTYLAEYSPLIDKWGSLDLPNIKISPELAVDIVDKNGGSNSRAKEGNHYLITASITAPGSGYDGWTINYITTDSTGINTIFEGLVDPKNGNFQIVSLK